MPTITQMKYVVSVAGLSSFQKAADACNVTQPTLSMQIQKLEGELEVILFDRSKKPVVVTERGAAFVERFRGVLVEVGQIEEMAKINHHELVGDFKVGIIPTISPVLSPLIFEHFQKKHPKLSLQLLEKTTSEIIVALKSEQIDCGVLSTPLQEKNISEVPVYQERLVVFHHPQLKIAQSPQLGSLEENQLMLLSEQNCLRQQTIGLCSMHATRTMDLHTKRFEAQSMTSLLEMVRNVPSYCLIPESFLGLLTTKEQKHQVKKLQDKGAFREVGLVRYRSQLKNRQFAALEQCMQSFVKKHQLSMHTKSPLLPLA
jgi:LysR family hydrogen peroxide-inducible transcriptional activator